MNMRFEPAHGLSGKLRPPADKSISHRAGLLGAMSAEPVRVENYLEAADTRSTLEAVRALGALVEENDGELVIRGTGLREAREPERPIDVGNAGTLLRLLPGWLAAQQGRSFTLDGDESIRRRPVDRIALPLRAMGARIEARDGQLRAGHGPRGTAARRRPRPRRRQRAGQVVPADGGADRRRHDDRRRAQPQPRPHRADAAARRRRHRPRGQPRAGGERRRAGARIGLGARRPQLGGVLRRRRGARARLAPAARRRRRQLDPHRASCGSCGACAGSCSATSRTSPTRSPPPSRRAISTSPTARSREPSSSRARCRSRSTSCRWWRCWAASPRARPS